MSGKVVVRLASADDVEALSLILCTSIRSGCVLDHRDRPEVVTAWTKNKSVASVLKWVEDSSLYLVVATLDATPVGVGMATATGEISLCYVLPEYFRKNVGKAIMATLEQWLKDMGFDCAVLNSTITGYHFYKRLGYRDSGENIAVMGLTASPMLKRIVASDLDSCAS